MRKICTLITLVGWLVIGSSSAFSQAATDEPGMLNGYPENDYYYTTVQIPETVLNSNKLEDKLNVALHHKMVNWEKEAARPLKSLDKNTLEATLVQLRAEAEQSLGVVAKKPAPQGSGQVTPKPRIIEKAPGEH